jgi:hypothetical protein
MRCAAKVVSSDKKGKYRRLGAIGILLLFTMSTSSANMMAVTLIEISNYADVVVDARVISSHMTNQFVPSLGQAEIIRVSVLDVVRVADDRPRPERQIDLLWFPKQEDYGDPQVGSRSIFFLAKCGNYYEPEFAYEGVAPVIDNSRVITSNILLQPKSLSLNEFKRRIKHVVKLRTLHMVSELRCPSMWKKDDRDQ